MDIAQDVKEFLMTRRAKITPERVGLPPGRRRRVPGLRREEVAQLAGVSIEYYTQIERGNVAGVSDDVLHAVARALRLTEEETAHLFDLVRAAGTTTGAARAPRRADRKIPDGVFPEWNTAADDAVALLRVEAAHSPHSTVVTGLVGELASRSEEFRTRWAAHNVKAHRHGVKQFRHPDVGDLSLTYNVFDITGADGLSLVGYTAEPQSPSEQALQLLAIMTATDTPSTATE
ncbi:helix-turn-helix transcriptional regulator [Rhodococcus koreensis]|uniref:helix-turn-helix transcriptional regulator n=1 Tax=Rhodococcus koreensis TaxID=99653 RepID=UPI0019816F8B|nr:helix-turn-helix transcriptional regulator [Rhodococcus koreensis]QSE80555.1 helix-turn-helix domain-containing protein [Rhodococcus koreensis]